MGQCYKITNNLLYFPSDIFSRKPLPNYAFRCFDPLTFTIPFSHSSASQNSFVPSALSLLDLWNSLPYHVKSNSFLITFKSKVNMLLLLTINSPSLIILKPILYLLTLLHMGAK